MDHQHAINLSDHLASLNPEQRQAAEHVAGPLLVVAGAGTGKTKTLAARVANLIHQGADPARILLLTFTRRAANEMIRRAGQVVGEALASAVWGGTFHAVANRLLRTYGQALGLPSSFVILDQGDAEDLLHLIRTDLNLHKAKARFPQKGTLLAVYSRCVNSGQPLEQVLTERFAWCQNHRADIRRIFQEYGQRKSQRNLLDYDDLLLHWDQALDDPGLGPALAGRFQHVLVDEYQDTNPLQASILRKMWAWMTKASQAASEGPASAAASCSIMVVGDDAQSIYSFRGATVENILQFPTQFPATTMVTLEQNYRSIPPILAAANAVMTSARQRFTKNLWSERAGTQRPMLVTCTDEIVQSRYVATRLLKYREEGIPLSKQAVLFRAGHDSDALEVELSRRNIPFVKWGGLKFLEAAHVKDLLAFLRLLENPLDDLSGMRVLQLLDGIGPGRARQAVQYLQDHGGDPQALLTWKAPAAAREQLQDLVQLLKELGSPGAVPPLPAQIERIRQFYTPLFENRYEEPEMRARDLEQLELLAHQAATRAAFLAALTLAPPSSTGDLAGPASKEEEYVVLSTIHSAKGCEWPVVYLIHAADGVIPSDRAESEAELEEERRLLYVAMTRARDQLPVTFPRNYYRRRPALGDAYNTAQLSRFLPPDVFPLFQRVSCSLPQPAATAAGQAGAVPVSASVQAWLTGLWK